MAARYAISLDLPGISHLTLDRLRSVARNHFRGTDRLARRRIEQRALTAEQYADLYAMLAEEWQRYLDGKRGGTAYQDLPALVACWIAFTDGVRASEINTLVVADIRADPQHGKHKLHAHAPNKEPDLLPIDDDSLRLLEALVRDGAESRVHLGTDHLFVSVAPWPRLLTSIELNAALRRMIRRRASTNLPHDLMLPDGRTTMGTHLARTIGNRERVRRIMRHRWASTTETYYRARQKVVSAGNIAKALAPEAYRLTVAIQRPVLDVAERPDLVDILARNPDNASLPGGSCGLDVERQGTCRRAKHCFTCPLFVAWATKRNNIVAERDEYVRLADLAETQRERENRLEHAALAEAHIILIDRRIAEGKNLPHDAPPARQRRPRSRQR